MKLKFGPATLIAALLLTTTFATQAAPTDHWKRPSIDKVTTQGVGGGTDSISPGDPFVPERPERAQPGQTFSPFSPRRTSSAPAISDPGYSQSEAPDFAIGCGNPHPENAYVWLTNNSGVTIPKGTWFAVSYPVNQVVHEKLPFDLPPGYGLVTKLAAADDEGFTCSAWVWKDDEIGELGGGVVP